MATGDKVFLRIQTRAHALSTNEPRTKPVYNVWDFQRTNTGGTPSKTAAATAMTTALLVPLKACLSVSYVTDYLDVRWLDDPLDPYTTTTLTQSGTIAGDSVPSLNNAYLKLTSGLRGGTNRGAKHLGPLAESSTLLDELTSAELALLATFITAYLAGFTGSDGFSYLPYIVSEKFSNLKGNVADVKGIRCTGVVVTPVLGQMQRRAQFRRSSI